MADRLTLTHAFEDAGIERAKAERVASAIFDVIHDEVATKADLQEVRGEISSLAAATKADSQAVRSEMNAGFQSLRTEIQAVRSEMHIAIRDVKIWTGGAMVAAVGIIIAAIRFLGHG
jgi:hypothetical protein